MRMNASLLLLLLPTVLSAQDPGPSSSSVADAAEQLSVHRAHMTNDIHLLSGTRFAGPAVTMRLVRDDKASISEAGLAAIKLIEGSPAGSVVVAVLDEDKGFAVFGSTFSALAKARNLAGFVVDGSVRDLTDLQRIGFPILARGTVAGSAGRHYRIEGVNVAVQCGGIEVRPGDYIVGDSDGVAVVPKELYAKVLAAAKRVQDEKQALLPLIEKNGSYLKAMQERAAAIGKP